MFSGRSTFTLAFSVLLGLMGSAANADTLVYNNTTTDGTLSYPGDLVESFTVNQSGLAVTNLAVFDSAAKNTSGPTGITTNLMVGLFNDTTNSIAIAAQNFNGTAYNGTGGSFVDPSRSRGPFALISGDTDGLRRGDILYQLGFIPERRSGHLQFARRCSDQRLRRLKHDWQYRDEHRRQQHGRSDQRYLW